MAIDDHPFDAIKKHFKPSSLKIHLPRRS